VLGPSLTGKKKFSDFVDFTVFPVGRSYRAARRFLGVLQVTERLDEYFRAVRNQQGAERRIFGSSAEACVWTYPCDCWNRTYGRDRAL